MTRIISIKILGAFAKLYKATIAFGMPVRLSICPHGTRRFPLDRFSLKLIFKYFSKRVLLFSFHQNLTSIKGALHEDQYTFLSHLAQFFLE